MITVSDVITELKKYADMEGYSDEQLYPGSERGLLWVKNRLRDDVDEKNPLILHTAAALAHFYFFMYRLSDPDKYSSYKVGDMTINRDLKKEFETEKNIRKEAIAAASSILKDGGFCCIGT